MAVPAAASTYHASDGAAYEVFLGRWTRLEAVSKALGCGLGQPISWDERDWAVRRFVPKPGYIGSVVVRK